MSPKLRAYRSWTLALGLGLSLAVLTSCASDKSKSSAKADRITPNLVQDQQIATTSGLEIVNNRFRVTLREFSPEVLKGYNTCSDLSKDLEEVGKQVANQIIEQYKNYYYDHDGAVTIMEDSVRGTNIPAPQNSEVVNTTSTNAGANQSVTSSVALSAQTKDASTGASSSFGTNNQVRGVDEADIVKSDGKYIYIAYGNNVILHDLNGKILDQATLKSAESNDPTPTNAQTLSKPGIALSSVMGLIAPRQSESVRALLFRDNRLLVISSGYKMEVTKTISAYPYDSTISYTRLSRFEVTTDNKLKLLDEQQLTGNYSDGREIEGKIYLVLSHSLYNYTYPLMNALSRYQPDYAKMTAEQYQTAALAKAQAILPEWREGMFQGLLATSGSSLQAGDCAHIVQLSQMRQSLDSNAESPFSENSIAETFAQIVGFDLTQGFSTLKKAGAFVPTAGLTLYSNQDVLVLGGQGYRQFSAEDWRSETFLMGFTLKNGEATPASVGSVEGYLNDQFNLDYHKDHLRVASTIEQRWVKTGPTWNVATSSESLVTVLKFDGNQMKKVGEVRGLGKGERIYATRFLGDRGFVVTFRQTDPFYTLDLADPANPKAVGELKISGFSNYLHPLGTNHILAVGQEADPNTGRAQGLQVAIFDVSNLANPQQVHKQVIEGYSYSAAQGDHKAFRYLEDQGKLILPLSEYSQTGQSFDGFQIYDVSVASGIQSVGRITHADDAYIQRWCFTQGYLPPRSLVFESQQLVTLKGHSVASHHLLSLAKQWNSELEPPQPKDETCHYFPVLY